MTVPRFRKSNWWWRVTVGVIITTLIGLTVGLGFATLEAKRNLLKAEEATKTAIDNKNRKRIPQRNGLRLNTEVPDYSIWITSRWANSCTGENAGRPSGCTAR